MNLLGRIGERGFDHDAEIVDGGEAVIQELAIFKQVMEVGAGVGSAC